MAGTNAPFVGCDGAGFPSVIGLEKHQRNKSKLVVGIDAPFVSLKQRSNLVNSLVKTDVVEFASTLTKPHTTQPSYNTGITLRHYLRDSDIMCFPEPVLGQSYQQQHHSEERGVIQPPSYNTSSTDTQVNDSILDVDKRVRLTTRGELLEYLPSNDMYKVSTPHCIVDCSYQPLLPIVPICH